MVDKSEFAIATSQLQNLIPFLIELLFNLLSQIITISTIKLTYHPVRFLTHKYLRETRLMSLPGQVLLLLASRFG